MISRSGAVICLALLLATLFASSAVERRIAQTPKVRISDLPLVLGEWQGEDTAVLDIAARETLQLDQFARRLYHHPDGRSVYLYVGYWQRQTGDHQAAKHSPALCLPANGWVVVENKQLRLTPEHPEQRINALVAERNTKKFSFRYWFFSGTESYADEWLTLFKVSFGLLAGHRPDGGIVELSASRESGTGDVDATLDEFARLVAPQIEKLTAAHETTSHD